MITHLVVHHFGGTAHDSTASTAHHTGAHINIAHKQRWADMQSKLNGSFVGYNIIIFPDGHFEQYRYVGEETVANIGYNKSAISVCLAGNFTIGSPDNPTYQQRKTLSDIGQACLKGRQTLEMMGIRCFDVHVGITLDRIISHRQASPNHTDCYGTKLANDWARTVVMAGQQPNNIESMKLTLMQEIVRLYMQMLDLLRARKHDKLGSLGDRECAGLLFN